MRWRNKLHKLISKTGKLLLLRTLPVSELSALAVVGGNLCSVLVVALVAVAYAVIV